MGDWLPEPDSLASQLVVEVWLGSAIAFTIGYRVTESGITAWRQGPATRPLEGPSWIVGVSITDSGRASTPYSGTLNHPAPHVPAQARTLSMVRGLSVL